MLVGTFKWKPLQKVGLILLTFTFHSNFDLELVFGQLLFFLFESTFIHGIVQWKYTQSSWSTCERAWTRTNFCRSATWEWDKRIYIIFGLFNYQSNNLAQSERETRTEEKSAKIHFLIHDIAYYECDFLKNEYHHPRA